MTKRQQSAFQTLLSVWNNHEDLRSQNANVVALAQSADALAAARFELRQAA